MRFNCRKKKTVDRSKWHRWFAWFPVRVGENDCRWLEFVYRKGTQYSYPSVCDVTGYAFEVPYWEYEYMEMGMR